MSKGKKTPESTDRAAFFKLVRALEDGGIPNARKIAELVAALVNVKISHSEGRHFSRHHAPKMPLDML